MKTYNEIKEAIANAPSSYLPGLLVWVVRSCTIRGLLRPGGAARIASATEDDVRHLRTRAALSLEKQRTGRKTR